MTKINYKKRVLINKLIENDIKSVQQNMLNNDVYWLGLILENGFCGYKNQSIKKLETEIKERRIYE
jgi:hypothetical protein